jgi:hypothetical protein
MQGRTPSSQLHKSVRRHKICPGRRDLAQLAGIVLEIHVALAENTAVFYQIKLLASQGMKRMSNLHSPAVLVCLRCNQRGIETHIRRRDLRRVSPGRAAPTSQCPCYNLGRSMASNLSGGRNRPRRKVGGTKDAIASSFSVGSALR